MFEQVLQLSVIVIGRHLRIGEKRAMPCVPYVARGIDRTTITVKHDDMLGWHRRETATSAEYREGGKEDICS